MLLSDVVATSVRVTATPARSAKIAALADLLTRLDPDELEIVVALLTGEPRQGRIGIGWRTLQAVDASPAAEPSLSVTDLDTAIDELQSLGGPGSVAARQRLLRELLTRATADETDFVWRLLGGELRQGALAGVMADAIAKATRIAPAAVRRAAMLAGDLARIAHVARADGENGLAAIGLQVLRPVQPMLASTAASVHEAIDACGFSSVEWKLDGVRLQIHRDGDDVALFTRNLNDVTARLPAVVALVQGLPVRTFVADGELLGAGDDERPDVFQDTMSRFGRHDGAGDGKQSLGLWFFDCLHADGVDLIDEPLIARLEVLSRVASALRIPSVLTDDPEQAAAFLASALDAGHEGVMVKGALSTYEAGRRGKAWRKVKPVRTLDLVVLAAEWGHGRRRGWLSNLHLGARDPDGGFVMVGKTFKGMTDQLLTWQTARLQELKVDERGIEVHVRPELVVEIALDGVQASTRYAGGVALRFARVKRYRPDKDPSDADTIGAVRALLHGS